MVKTSQQTIVETKGKHILKSMYAKFSKDGKSIHIRTKKENDKHNPRFVKINIDKKKHEYTDKDGRILTKKNSQYIYMIDKLFRTEGIMGYWTTIKQVNRINVCQRAVVVRCKSAKHFVNNSTEMKIYEICRSRNIIKNKPTDWFYTELVEKFKFRSQIERNIIIREIKKEHNYSTEWLANIFNLTTSRINQIIREDKDNINFQMKQLIKSMQEKQKQMCEYNKS